jgi:hypothetical protein
MTQYEPFTFYPESTHHIGRRHCYYGRLPAELEGCTHGQILDRPVEIHGMLGLVAGIVLLGSELWVLVRPMPS